MQRTKADILPRFDVSSAFKQHLHGLGMIA
jgi:hypothetical protein